MLLDRLVSVRSLALLATAALAFPSFADITGSVFQDFNSNGVRNTTTTVPNEGTTGGTIGAAVDQYLANVSVTAVCVTNRGADGVLGTADDVTATFGPVLTTAAATSAILNYTLTTTGVYAPTAAETSAGKRACRVEFAWNETAPLVAGAPNPLFGMRPAFVGAGSNTATQFVDNGGTANLGLNYPGDFCQNNPSLATNCGTFGPAATNTAGAIYTFPYSARSNPVGTNSPNPPTTRATAAQVGSTWGLAYHKSSKNVLVSAYFKRHIGVGPGGVGQIYSVPAASGTPTSFVNLETLVPGSTGADPRVAGNDFVRDLAVLSGNNLLVGKLGIGDIDLSDDNTTLYAVGLNSKKLYRMTVSTGGGNTLTAPSTATTINLPTIADIGTAVATGCPVEGDLRPFALKYNKGFLYVGITCTAESTITNVSQTTNAPGGDPTRLRAFIYRMDTTTNAFTQVANFSLNVTGRAAPLFGPWNNSDLVFAAGNHQNPQPLVADIEFNGANMLVGVRDRFGDSTGRGTQYLDTTNASTGTDGRGHGDTYLACPNAAGTSYDPANCPTSGFSFYLDDQVDQNSAMGGLAQVPGFPDYVYTKKDPVQIWSSGIGWNSHANGAYTKGYEILFSNPGPQTGSVYNNMGKSSSFGDVEALCDAAPIEIGNRVWNDANGNGIQDPGEAPIAGVTVNLYAPNGTTVLATAVTDANGNYYFSNRTQDEAGNALTLTNGGATVNAITGLTPNTTGYQIRFDNAANYSSGPLANLRPTVPNATGNTSNNPITDLTDSDATLANPNGAIAAGNFPTITFNTGGPGENNFGLDAGFNQTFSLGNRVWGDTNNDGILNNSESVFSDILVRLTDGAGNQLYRTPAGAFTTVAAGNTIARVVTDSAGYYRFDGLPAGDYRAVVDAGNWTGFIGNIPTGTLDGAVVGFTTPQNHLAGYSSSTPGTNGVTGVTSGAGSTNNNDKGVNPAAIADYLTAGVSSGTVTLGAGNQPTTDVDSGTPPAAGQNGPRGDASDNLTVDFGFFRLTVGDTLWYDNGAGGGTRNDGLKNGSEPGVPAGVTVQLLKNGVVVATTTTDANGNYLFTQQTNAAGVGNGLPLVPGNDYQVSVPANQAALNGTTSSATPAAQPNPNNVNPTTNDDGDSGTGTADAFANATTTGNFTLGPSDATTPGTLGANQTYAGGPTTLIPGAGVSHKPNIDLGFVPALYAIGNRVWFDTNNNGVKDSAEVNAPNVLMELLDNNGTVVATTATNAQGEYVFDNLPAGTYTVRVAASNWTGITAAQVAAAGSPAGLVAGTRPLAGYNNSSANNAVSGATTVDASDKGITNASPATNGISSPAVTVGPGLQPTGESATTDNDGASATVAGDANDNMAIDFGFYKLSVGNLVFNDNGATGGTANDGIRNGNEPGISGVTVQLVDSSNNVVAQTLTGPNGDYSFDQLTNIPAVGLADTPNGQPIPPGTYTLRLPAGQAPLAGLISSSDPAGGGQSVGDSRDNGAGTVPSTSVINSSPISLTAAGTLPAGAVANNANGTTDQPRMDFGVTPGFSLGNRVFLDNGAGGGTRNDGIQNGGETGIGSVIVNLLDGSGAPLYRQADGSIGTAVTATPVTTSTDSTGYYRFDNLPAGSYTVEVVGASLPANVVSSTGTQGATVDRGDKGLDTPVGGNTRSAPVTLGPGLQPTGEADLTAAGPGAQGPGGDANTNSTIDFGFVPPIYAIGNRIWFDTNNNGVKDAGEGVAAGVLVELIQGGSVTATTATNAQGEYVFDNLPAGTYTVRVAASNWTGITAAQVTAAGSPAGLVAGTRPLAGYNNSTADNAVPGAGAVGTADGTDKGIFNAAPATNGISSPSITLGPNQQPTGENATGDNDGVTGTTAGDANDNMAVDFGFYKLSVGNLVFNDNGATGGTANDGIRNGGEPGIAGVTVQLVNSSNVVVAQTLTDGNGNYSFDQLTNVPAVGTAGTPNGQPIPAGTYTVRLPAGQAPLAGLISSGDPAGGGQVVGDSRDNGVGTAPTTSPINSAPIALQANGTLPAGAVANNVTGTTDQPRMDFGVTPGFSLGNRVFLDNGGGTGGVRNDGIQNGSEPGVSGVTINLLNATGQPLYRQPDGSIGTTVTATPVSVNTDQNGYYRFDDLPAGSYVVEVVSSTGPLATAVGSTGTAAGDRGDKGVDQPAGTNVRSAPVTVGPGLQPTGEPDLSASGPGAQGPSGDANTNSTIDFGFVTPVYAIGNRIWFDANNNGIKDASEGVAAGVIVELVQGGNVIATTATNAQGEYVFDNLPAGSYTVRVAASNWAVGGITAAQAAAAGNAALATTRPLQGYASSTPNNPVPGAGAVGTADGTDKGINSATPATGGISSPSITLGPNQQPTGESASGDNDGAATTAAGDANDNMAVDFGFYRLTAGNQIWIENNANSTYTPGTDLTPTSVQNIPVELRDSATNAVIATTTTDATGNYQFVSTATGNPIPAGAYYVSLPSLPGGARPIPIGTPLTDNNSQGTVPATPIAGVAVRTGTFNLAPGVTTENQTVTASTGTTAQPTLDMGFAAAYSLGNRVWVDSNNDGVLNNGEAGLDGVTVNLRDGAGAQLYLTPSGAVTTSPAGNTAITTTTSNGGYYLFTGLPPGAYVVEIQTPTVGTRSYVSSTGVNGGVTGPYEPTGNAAFPSTATNVDHGVQFAPNVIRSRPVTLGPGQPTGEDGNATPGRTDTTPDDQSNLTLDFGVFLPASVGTVVWIDDGAGGGTPGDGIKQAGEAGIPGVTVTLVDPAGAPIDGDPNTSGVQPITTTTGPNGTYSITNLVPGTYAVQFTFPAGSTVTNSPNPAGSGTPPTNTGPNGPDNQFNEMNPTTLRSPPVTLTAGQDNPNLDAGVRSFNVREAAIPTMGEWMYALFALMLLAVAAGRLRRAPQPRRAL